MQKLATRAFDLGYDMPFHELDKRIDAFLVAVSDPLNPTCCPRCFTACVLLAIQHSVPFFAQKQYAHDLWETCINLLVIYAESDVPRLRQQLQKNQRDCTDRMTLHKGKFHNDLTDSYEVFIDALLEFVTLGMKHGENPIYNAGDERQSFENRDGAWPTDLKS
ncbi:hypothetical protein AURDEDRAFT_173804 [Auricularia subglabra TFB-10046 SS5]|nr:hypothetical protein AURDEDRAFT_173804 [Auricularia subglabra TFB-10046 SS5]